MVRCLAVGDLKSKRPFESGVSGERGVGGVRHVREAGFEDGGKRMKVDVEVGVEDGDGICCGGGCGGGVGGQVG